MANQSGGTGRGGVAVYDDRRTAPLGDNDRDISMSVATPADRVRWGPILAGLFTALTTLLLLTLLALALGAATFDQSSTARSFGLGSAIVAGLIWLLSFGVGGYVAARTAAFPGRSNGIFNGLMVAIVGIPLLLYALGSLIGSLLGVAGNVASTAATAAAPVAGQVAQNPSAQASASGAAASIQASASGAAASAQAALQNVNPEQVADNAAKVGLGSLVPPLLSLAAAATGGAIGARKREERDVAIEA
jgi:hypothetical protein